MAEYIDREKLIAEYDRVHVGAAGGARKLMVDAPAEDVAPVAHWISVADRLPEEWRDKSGTFVNYLVYMPEYGVDVGNYMPAAGRWLCMGLPAYVTHWMPMPAPPEEKTEAADCVADACPLTGCGSEEADAE